MHQLLATQLDQMLSEASCPNGLSCAAPLRAAAATVSRADPDEIPATIVIGVLGADDMPAFRALVADIAKEFGVDASIRLHVGSFSYASRITRIQPRRHAHTRGRTGSWRGSRNCGATDVRTEARDARHR